MIVSRPGPDAGFFFFLRKRFLNLGGRGRAADQTLGYVTLILLRPESGISDRLTPDECGSVHRNTPWNRIERPGYPHPFA